jgi:hypothetical protein
VNERPILSGASSNANGEEGREADAMWPKAARQLSGVHITEADVRIGRRKVLTGPKADLLWSPKAAVS